MRLRKAIFFIILAFVFVFQFSQHQVSAHPFNIGVIKTNLTVHNQQILLSSDVSEHVKPIGHEGENSTPIFNQYFSQNLIITNNGSVCKFNLSSITFPAPNKTIFNGVLTCQGPVAKLSDLKMHNTLFSDYFKNYEHFIRIIKGSEHVDILLHQGEFDYPKIAANIHSSPQQNEKSVSSFGSVTREFIRLGIEHIWTGYDHILFLIMLLLPLRSFRKIIEVITAFTIAHSVTLILAGFNIITIPPSIVEPIIALTIVAVALRNLWLIKKKELDKHVRERWMTAAGFGLIHGLGFAGALKALGVPHDYFVPSLVFFNVGIEIGQLALLAVILPILLFVDKTKWKLKILSAICVVVALQAFVWFIDRIVK